MATTKFKDMPVHLSGDFIATGAAAPDFELVKTDLGTLSLSSLKGKRVILNIFPSLDEIVRKADGGVFNNAAQTWNHTFFFLTLTPDQQPMPEKLAAVLARDFGSVEAFREAFTKAAVGLFGSGWTWLAQQPDGKLVIVAESNAGNPMTRGLKPLLTVDVWEHAYYIDYRNRRAEFVKNWWDLVDWQKVADRL